MITPMEGNPVWRHKRSLLDEPKCYTGIYNTVAVKDGGLMAFPVCKEVALTACSSAIAKYGKRKCKGSNYGTYHTVQYGVKAYPKTCSCAS